MTNALGPYGSVSSARGVVRRRRRTDGEAGEESAAPSSGSDAEADDSADRDPPRAKRFGFAGYAAQILGGGPRRGLRGGPETLDRARTTYLETEWSGPADRRPKPGRVTKTEI